MPRLHPLLATIRRELEQAGDPARALGQQAYMKSAMPYHGVATPAQRVIHRRVFAGYVIDDEMHWQADVRALWGGAAWREERYAAIALLQLRQAKPFHRMPLVPLLEEMIVTGAWWDFVDTLASHDLGLVLEQEPKRMRREMLAWSKCDDIWKRRSAILCQLRFGTSTDLELLYACIEPSLVRREFWLRKATGWALRQLAWKNPDEVKRYVASKGDALAPLARREALKNIERRVTSSPAHAAKRKKT